MNAIERKKLERALGRAAHLYPRSQQYRNAYVRGARAALGGVSAESCPYRVDRQKTWANSYRRAWLLGYRSIAE